MGEARVKTGDPPGPAGTAPDGAPEPASGPGTAADAEAATEPGPASGTEPTEPDANAARQVRDAEAAELMARYQAGDGAAFDALVALVGPILYRFFVHGQVGDATVADDLYQELWLRAHDARHTFRPGEPVLPWLFGVARHVVLDHRRRFARHRRRVDALEQAGDAAASVLPQPAAAADTRAETAQMLHLAMEGLPESQREALFLLKVEGLPVKEAARIAGTSEGALKVRAHRAYAAVRARLDALMGEMP
jgi:RNA polymerase sigma-70 factor, ECF subfamily